MTNTAELANKADQNNNKAESDLNKSASNSHDCKQSHLLAQANGGNNDVSHLNEDMVSVELCSSSDQKAPKMLWRPTETSLQNSNIFRFQTLIENKFNVKFETYNDLYKWSIDNYLNFWEEFWHFSNLVHSKPYNKVLDKQNATVDSLPFKWFEGALLNYAENLLRYDDEKVAIYSFGEAFTKVKSITFRKLRERVALYQSSLKKLGVKKGDRVVGYLPNCIECAEAKLAVLSLGAVWSCTSPDFGSKCVVDRFKQIKPKVIFSVSSVAYNGKTHDHVAKLNEVINEIDSIEKVIIVPFCQDSNDDLTNIRNCILLDDFLSSAQKEEPKEELTFEQVPFDHPLVILFSSGTTGTPKCIVHSHGGTLIQHLKEHILHGNMSREDIILYYTTTGWMMYNWLMTSLAVGASIVLFDGSPMLPTLNVLWDLIDELGITMFGTSAKWLAVIEGKLVPKNTHKLDKLRIIYSTGSPLKPSSFDYVYSSIKEDLIIGSITGGTDIISLFCGHCVSLPVYREQIQCRCLGMAVECWSEDGKPVLDECGELVCTKPFPSMPIYFYGDFDFKKYKGSYFERFPGIWAHGDFCMIDSKTGGVTMFGRSDGVLNPNGVRFGSAEIYNVIENIEEVNDSLCVGQKNPNLPEEERVVLFIKLKKDFEFNQSLVDKVRARIRVNLSARHVPSVILPIEEIPYTLNGKKVEVPVRRIIEGVNVNPSTSLVNPKCLELFKHIVELKKW